MTDKQPMEDMIDESKHDNSGSSGADLTMISPELTESRPTEETPRVSAISRSVVERKKLVMSSENEEEEVLSKLSDSDDDILHGSPEPKTWLNLLDDLSDKLDPFSKREASKIIDEIIRLETYLNDENNLIEQENRNLKFSNQKEIIHYLNKALRVKLFNLSQSANMYTEYKIKFERILRTRLSHTNLYSIMGLYEQIDQDYINLFESTKSRLKIKTAKYESLINFWDQFDSNARHLNLLFVNHSDQSINSSLKYQCILYEMNSHLNDLNEELAHLTPICTDKAYYELKNQLIMFNLKYKSFRDRHEEPRKQLESNDAANDGQPLKSKTADIDTLPEMTTRTSVDASTGSKTNDDDDMICNENNNNNNNNNDNDNNRIIIDENDDYKEKYYCTFCKNLSYSDKGPNAESSPVSSSSSSPQNLVQQHEHHKHHHHHHHNHLHGNDSPSNSKQQHMYLNELPHLDVNNDSYLKDSANSSNSSNEKYAGVRYFYCKRAAETSDKCVATINEMGTQTDNKLMTSSGYSSIADQQHNTQLSPAGNYSSIESNNNSSPLAKKKTRVRSLLVAANRNDDEPADTEKKDELDKLLNSSSNGTDGKKMLLEAYLMNNGDNLLVNSSTSSSGVPISAVDGSSDLNKSGDSATSKSMRKLTETPVVTARESGICTMNEDELENSIRTAPLDDEDYNETTVIRPPNDSILITVEDLNKNYMRANLNNNNNNNNSTNNKLDANKISEQILLNNEFQHQQQQQQPKIKQINMKSKRSSLKYVKSSLLAKKEKIPLMSNRKLERINSTENGGGLFNDDDDDDDDDGEDIDDVNEENETSHHDRSLEIESELEDIVSSKLNSRMPDRLSPKFFSCDKSETEPLVVTRRRPDLPVKEEEPAKKETKRSPARTIFSLFKMICFFLFFLLPLILLLVVFVYYNFVNKSYSCCDFQRDYLFINVS